MLTQEDLEMIGKLLTEKIQEGFSEQADLIQAGFNDVYQRFDGIDMTLFKHGLKFIEIEKRLDQHDKRFDDIDRKMDGFIKLHENLDCEIMATNNYIRRLEQRLA